LKRPPNTSRQRLTFGDRASFLFGLLPMPGKVERYQRALNKARALAGGGNPAKAREICAAIVRRLSNSPSLTQEHKQCLYGAHLESGKILQARGDKAAALDCYLEARKIAGLPPQVLLSASCWLAEQGERSPEAIEVYMDCLRSLRGKARPPESKPVYGFLESLCRVDDTTGAQRNTAAAALCQKVIAADGSLDWAHYYLGMVFLKQERHAQAVKQFQAAQRLNPSHKGAAYHVHLCQGIVSAQAGEDPAALDSFRQAVAVNPGSHQAYYSMGKILLSECEDLEEKDDPTAGEAIRNTAAEAAEVLLRARDLNPQDPEYHFYLGRAYSFLGRSPEAVEAYRQAISLDSCWELYYLYLAIELDKQGQQEQALEAVRQALGLDRDYADAFAVWGDICRHGQDLTEAIEHYKQALSIVSQNLRARIGLGLSLYQSGCLAEAIPELEAVKERSRDAAYYLARCYSKEGRFAEAVPILTALARRPDSDWEHFYYLGCAHANTADYQRAMEAFAGAIRLDGSRWQAYLQRGHCHLKTGSLEEAFQDYEKAGQLQPTEASVILALANYYLTTNDDQQASILLAQMGQAQPGYYDARLLLGILAEKRGDMASAEQAYLGAIKDRSDRPEAYGRLGISYCHQERYSEAAQYLRKALSLGQDADPVLFHLGLSLGCSGEYSEALEVWGKLQERHPEDRRLALNINRLHYLLGQQHVAAERYQEAIEAWRTYLDPRPDDEPLKAGLAQLYLRAGVSKLAASGPQGVNEARSVFRSAMELDGGNSVVLFYTALCALLEGKPDECLRLLNEVQSHADPDLASRATYHAAIALLLWEKPQEAVRLLRDVQSDPNYDRRRLPLDWALAVAHAKGGQWERSLDALSRML
jgi:tetratricopeptide (TPR) repeat protein